MLDETMPEVTGFSGNCTGMSSAAADSCPLLGKTPLRMPEESSRGQGIPSTAGRETGGTKLRRGRPRALPGYSPFSALRAFTLNQMGAP